MRLRPARKRSLSIQKISRKSPLRLQTTLKTKLKTRSAELKTPLKVPPKTQMSPRPARKPKVPLRRPRVRQALWLGKQVVLKIRPPRVPGRPRTRQPMEWEKLLKVTSKAPRTILQKTLKMEPVKQLMMSRRRRETLQKMPKMLSMESKTPRKMPLTDSRLTCPC